MYLINYFFLTFDHKDCVDLCLSIHFCILFFSTSKVFSVLTHTNAELKCHVSFGAFRRLNLSFSVEE